MDNLQTTTEQARGTEAKKKTVSAVDKNKPEKIRVELNIEKWPGIWQPAKAHTKLTARTLERQVELKDGGRAVSKLIIGFTDLGTLTTEDQRMFYALIRQWEDAGKPVGKPVYFSDRLLSRLLKKKGWGTNVLTAITGSLRRLRTIPLRWIKSFHKNDPASSQYEEEIPFQILGDLKIVTRKSHGHVTNQQGYFQFDRNIEANLAANYTKPLLDEVFLKLESEIAQLIYTHIDLVMFGKTRYERCTRELFADLGLSGSSYRFKSNRRQKLERALSELRGVRLNHGVIKSATIEETRDGKDYKVVFTKAARMDQELELEADLAEPIPVVVNHYVQTKDALQLQAEELVSYFHKVFHEVNAHLPQSKEISQALSLISQYGLSKARLAVEFAYEEAQKTNYSIQHFGAILSYASRAAALVDRQISARPQRPVAEPTPSAPRELLLKGERRLNSLTTEQHRQRFDTTKAALFQEAPFLAHRWKEGSKLHESMIRSRMVRDLQVECMDLLPLSLLPTWYPLQTQNLEL